MREPRAATFGGVNAEEEEDADPRGRWCWHGEKWDAGAGAIGGIGTKEEGDGGATTASRRRCQVESARGGGGGSRSCG
jgi:hypothetical protein